LVAFAAARLWERRDREARALTAEGYAAMGGVEGALAQHAEETLARIGPAREPLVRELFRNLVTAQGTRAVIGWDELVSVAADRDAVEQVLRELVDARLLTTYEDGGAGGEAPTRRVEIVHESLLTMWPRLVRWRTQDESGAQLRDQLRQAAHLWDAKGRSRDLLWTGTSYHEYAVWRERHDEPLTDVEAAFAAAMADRARRRRRIAVAITAAVVLALAGVAAAIAVSRQRAVESARRAEASRLVALGRLDMDRFPTAAVAYARKSLETADTLEARLLAVEALWRGPVARLWGTANCGARLAFAPGGDRLVCAGFMRDVVIAHADGAPPVLLALDPTMADLREAVFVDGGRHLLTWLPGDDRVRLIDLQGTEVRSFPGDAHLVRLVGEDEFVACGAAPGSGDRVVRVVSWRDGTTRAVHTWTPPSGMRFDQPGVRPIDIDAGLRWMAYADDRAIRLHPLGAGARDRLLGTHDRHVRELLFDPRGDRLLSIDESGVAVLWRLPDGGSSRLTSSAPIPRFALPTFLPGGSGVAWTIEGVGVNVWRFDSSWEEPPLVLRQPTADYAGQVVVDAAGQWLAAGYAAGFSLWPLRHPAPRRLLAHTEGPTERLAFSPDGRFLVSCARDGARLWPMGAGSLPSRRLEVGGDYMCYDVAVSPDSTQVAIASPFKGLYLVAVDGGTPRRLLDYSGTRLAQAGLAFDRAGTRLAVGHSYAPSGYRITLEVVTLATGDVTVFPVGDGTSADPYADGIYDLAFVADDLVSVAGRSGVWTFDLSGRRAPLLGAGFAASALSGDRRRLAVLSGEAGGSEDFLIHNGTAIVIDVTGGGRREVPWPRGSYTHALALDSSGERLVASDLSGTLRVGRAEGGPPHLLIGHANRVTDIAISPDDRWIASAAGTEIRLWPMPDVSRTPLHALPHAQLMATLRTLTNLEVVADATAETGYRLHVGPFPGWKDRPEW
jgi:WD40 repeat protein